MDIRRPFKGIANADSKDFTFSITEKIEFDANTSQIIFPIKSEEKLEQDLQKFILFRKGSFSNNLITHSVGQGGQIRIDNPPPKPKSALPTKPVVQKRK